VNRSISWLKYYEKGVADEAALSSLNYMEAVFVSESKDLDILIPGNEIKLGSGESVIIQPFPFAKLPEVIALINSIGVGVFTFLEAGSGLKTGEENKEEGTATLEIDDLVIHKINNFIESHFDEVVEVLAIYCRRPKGFFLDEEIGPNIEEACQILLTIVERHLGFFMKTLRPIISRIRSKAN
jgi:hypothetical protein